MSAGRRLYIQWDTGDTLTCQVAVVTVKGAPCVHQDIFLKYSKMSSQFHSPDSIFIIAT